MRLPVHVQDHLSWDRVNPSMASGRLDNTFDPPYGGIGMRFLIPDTNTSVSYAK